MNKICEFGSYADLQLIQFQVPKDTLYKCVSNLYFLRQPEEAMRCVFDDI